MASKGTIAVAFISFCVGCAIPIMYTCLTQGAQHVQKMKGKISGLTAFAAFVVSFALGSIGLVYLSTISKGDAPIIVVAAMTGLGFVRWLRNEL